MASGHMNRVKRPDTWLHRPMLRNVKKVLANPEPSTHGPRPDIPLVAIKVMRWLARCPNEPVLQRCNDPGSTFMRGSFPALARY